MRPQTCIGCHEAITNPICPGCLENEIVTWLSERRPELVRYIEGASTNLTNDWVTYCIVCGSQMGVCGHCFTKEVLEAVREQSPDLEEEFLLLFNFELR